jgi:hypothetical protein
LVHSACTAEPDGCELLEVHVFHILSDGWSFDEVCEELFERVGPVENGILVEETEGKLEDFT